jgi:hypothetical protein
MRNIGKEKEREWNSEREVWWLLVAMFAFHGKGKVSYRSVLRWSKVHREKGTEEDA